MSVASAAVEVLTAEVRVLMVGSRQVTLSVFRQLDCVPADVIEPMGRVTDSRDGDSEDRWVIGRDDGGTLCRSKLWPDGTPFFSGEAESRLERLIELREHPEWQPWHERHEEELARLTSWQSRYFQALNKYEELPLIVLAGLR